ncbi:hypothetical protein Tco_1215379 [Tanacetum coccineum]
MIFYNNLKVYEPEVKGMSSSSSSTHNMAFVSSSNNNNSSTNGAVSTAQAVNTANGVSTANTQVNASNIDNLRDAVIWDILLRKCKTQRNKTTRTRISTSGLCCGKSTSKKLLVMSCDGLGGYDWSDQAEEGPNYALMAYSSSSSDSEVSNNSNCSKSCLKTVETLKSQYDQLHKDFKKSELMVLAYKSGLESVEEKLEVYKANESIYSQDIKVLKFEIECKDIAIRELKKKLEIAQKEKDGIQFNVDKFENASKSLNKLIESQIVDNCKKGLGYNAVLPPYTGNFMPPTPDLSFTGLDEFVNKPVVENRKSDEEVSKVVRKSNDSLIIKDWVSDSKEENVSQTKTKKKIVKPSIAKIEFVKPKQQEKTARKTVKQVEKHRQNTYTPRGNQRNWNNMMSQRLGSNFKMFNKACYVCGSFDHLPKAVVNAARPKAVVNVVKGNNVNAVKTSTCWGWKPKIKVLYHGNPQIDLQDQGVIDSGCSRHMTGNMSYLTDYKEIDGGYVAFGGNPKGGKITGKGTIKTGNLDFENVYFVRELKFNLFNVSQMCDKKNSVLFNDTECIVLSPNFKLTDESHVLLKTDIQEKEQKESQKQANPSTGRKGPIPEPPVRQPSVESSNLEKPDNPPIVTMADNRTMAQLLEAPTEGYEDAIVIPEITANNFEIKHGLLNLVQNKQFFGNDKEDPHAHIRYFNKITSTMKIPNVPNTSVKLMLFPFSLEGAARIWLEKEPSVN